MTDSQEQAEREREQHVREQAATQAQLRLAAIVESSADAIIEIYRIVGLDPILRAPIYKEHPSFLAAERF